LSTTRTLKSLEIVLESFLVRAIDLKEERLGVLDDLNTLDDLTRSSAGGDDVTEDVADWIAKRRGFLTQEHLRHSDMTRIDQMLGEISRKIKSQDRVTPAQQKISDVISGWRSDGRIGPGKTTLKRGEEIREDDSIALFSTTLEDIQGLYLDMAERQKHVLSVLEDALKSARLQKNRQALLLAGFLIYYLKQHA